MAAVDPHDSRFQEEVARLVEAICGERPARLEHMWFGGASATFDASLTGRSVIVRTNVDTKAFAATTSNLEALAALGLPVPRALATGLKDDSPLPFAYMVLPKIPGRDLRFELPTMTRAQQTAVAERVVAAQELAATLPSPGGYGYTAIGLPGPLDRWRAVLDCALPPISSLEGHLAELAKRVSARLDGEEPYLSEVPSVCFLDDLTTKNVIVEAGELRGFVDFDCVCLGDRLLQIGLTLTAIAADLGGEDPFYVDELCRLSKLDSSSRMIVDLYAALFAVEFLARGVGSGDDQRRLVELIDRWR